MTKSTIISKLPVSEDASLVFALDNSGFPLIECYKNDTLSTYIDFSILIKEVPELYQERNLQYLAMSINFLMKKNEFQFISEPENYKKWYWEQIEREQNSFELPLHSLISYGIFNVNEITRPHIEPKNDQQPQQLIFYVSKFIPYKVICDFPLENLNFAPKYAMLDYAL